MVQKDDLRVEQSMDLLVGVDDLEQVQSHPLRVPRRGEGDSQLRVTDCFLEGQVGDVERQRHQIRLGW